MANFKFGEEIRQMEYSVCHKHDMQRKKTTEICFPDGNRTHDLLSISWMLYPLSYLPVMSEVIFTSLYDMHPAYW